MAILHSHIKIEGLTLRQWDYLQDNVNHVVTFRPSDVRVCAEFELTPDMSSLHAELPVTDLAGMLIVLKAIEQAAQAEAVLSDAEQIVGRALPVEENQPQGGRELPYEPGGMFGDGIK